MTAGVGVLRRDQAVIHLGGRDMGRRASTLAGVRILVVDDDEGVLSALTDGFALYGAVVSGAESAAQARASLAKARFDVLVSDINMPIEDGCQLMASIRMLGDPEARSIRALAITASLEGPLRGRALHAGFDRVVSKLIDFHELLDEVLALVAPQSVAPASSVG
jgi:CheY-like chemotaxis protein